MPTCFDFGSPNPPKSRLGGVLGASWSVLGCLGASWGRLGSGVLGRFWGILGLGASSSAHGWFTFVVQGRPGSSEVGVGGVAEATPQES